MKKLIYLVVMAATLSLTTACNGKDKEKDNGEDDEIDLTLVVSADELPFA